MEFFLNVKEARKLFSQQPDFREQREWFEETISQGGCLIDLYPKYNCEFNNIEMFWGAAKAWCRARCTFNFNDHVALVPKAIERVLFTKSESLPENRIGTWMLIALKYRWQLFKLPAH